MWFRNLRAVALVGATTLVLGSPCLQAAEQAGDGLHALKEHPQVGSNGLAIKVLSSRNDVISGGDALIEVSSQQPDAGTAVIRLNGVDVSKTFKSHGDANVSDVSRVDLIGNDRARTAKHECKGSNGFCQVVFISCFVAHAPAPKESISTMSSCTACLI